MLDEYLRAADVLTINSEYILQKRFDKITEETKNNEYIVRGNLQEKDQEIQSMQEQIKHMRDDMNDVLEVLKIAKTNNGNIENDKTMFVDNRRVTFGFIDKNNRLSEVKIHVELFEIDENVLLGEN